MPEKNRFEAVFEVFEIKVRRLRNGNRISFRLEMPADLNTEKKLIAFRGLNVKAIMKETSAPKNKIEDVFEVFDIGVRTLKNGNKLYFILEQAYDKAKEIEAVGFRYDEVKIEMEKTQEELDFGQNEEAEEEENGYNPEL